MKNEKPHVIWKMFGRKSNTLLLMALYKSLSLKKMTFIIFHNLKDYLKVKASSLHNIISHLEVLLLADWK